MAAAMSQAKLHWNLPCSRFATKSYWTSAYDYSHCDSQSFD